MTVTVLLETICLMWYLAPKDVYSRRGNCRPMNPDLPSCR